MNRHLLQLMGEGMVTLVLAIWALRAAAALDRSHPLQLGFIVGLLAFKAKGGFPWHRVARTVRLGLLLCCAALLLLQHVEAKPAQTVMHPSQRDSTASGVMPDQVTTSSRAASDRVVSGSDSTSLRELQDQLKEVKEGINHTVTIWSLLLAALALILSFVTSWVIGIAKDAKDQVDQLRESARLQDRLMILQRESLRQANLLEINRQLELIANDAIGAAQRQYLLQVRRALVESPELHDPFALPQTRLRMERSLLVAQNIVGKSPDLWNSSGLKSLQARVLEWLTSEHQIVQGLPHLRGADGEAALEVLRGWVRLLR